MSLAEIKNFIKSTTKRQALRQMQLISSHAIASQSDSRGIKKTLAEIEKSITDD